MHHRGSICKEVQSRHPEPKLPFSTKLLLLCLKLACSEKLSCHEFLINRPWKNCRHKFPSNNKPSRFWNANSPPNISPAENKPPPKKTFEKYKPRGLFSEFYGTIHDNTLPNYNIMWSMVSRATKHSFSFDGFTTVFSSPNQICTLVKSFGFQTSLNSAATRYYKPKHMSKWFYFKKTHWRFHCFINIVSK